jgi:hypothetical protein
VSGTTNDRSSARIETNGGTIEATGAHGELSAVDVVPADDWLAAVDRVDDTRFHVVFTRGSNETVEVDVALTAHGIVSSTRSVSS